MNSEDSEQMDAALRDDAARMASLRFDPERGRTLAEQADARERANVLAVDVSWRRVAGSTAVEPRHSWLPVPETIVDVLGDSIASRLSVRPNGPPDAFDHATVELDVFAELPGTLTVIDSTGTEHPLAIVHGTATCEIPLIAMSRGDQEAELPHYQVEITLGWNPSTDEP